jgi:hypothetical protein
VYELLCVSDDQKVIDHFLQTSKVWYKLSSYDILILFNVSFN